MGSVADVATVVAAVGCGLMAGIFFAFSVFLMAAFDRLAPSAAIAAMQSINRTILTPLFLLVFLGSGVACVVATATAFAEPDHAGRAALVAATACYLVGVLAVTSTASVPRNVALDALDPAAPDAASAWTTYRRPWTAWNHVRTLASIAAAVLLVVV
jgi:uncharacterized membrane protein